MNKEARKEAIIETLNALCHEDICRIYFGVIDETSRIVDEISYLVEDMDDEELDAIEELLHEVINTSSSDVPDMTEEEFDIYER
jgi:hypothetical protein